MSSKGLKCTKTCDTEEKNRPTNATGVFTNTTSTMI